MTDNLITKTLVGKTLVLTINRPDKKNALTTAMYETLTEDFIAASQDDGVRSLMIKGAGGNFTSGNDLKDFMAAGNLSADSPVMQFLKQLAVFPKPLIAAVEGCAIGIGTTLLLHCEFVVSADNALFQTPFIRLGLVPEGASSLLMPQKLGYHHAAKLLLTGESVSAQDALAMGLVAEVVAPGEVEAKALALAESLNQLPPAAMRLSKTLLKGHEQESVLTTIVREAEVFAGQLQSEEAKEAFTAFFEKRKPDWSRFS